MKRTPILLLLLVLAAIAPFSAVCAARTDIVEGNPFSEVKVTIYSDLQCDFCQTLRVMLDEKLLPKYGKQVAFVHRDLPLGRHDWARAAAMAARWVYAQDSRLGIQFRRELLDEQQHITPATLKPWVIQFAVRNHLSEQGIAESLTDPHLGTLVDEDSQIAAARGIDKIPAVFVGGHSFTGVIVYDDIARVLDQLLGQ